MSKSDFYSKAKVTFVGHYNYYVMPLALYEQVKQDIPYGIGAMVYEEFVDKWGRNAWQMLVTKKPKWKELKVPSEHLSSRFITSSHRDLYRLIGGRHGAK